MNRTRLISTMAVLIALGTITAQLVWFPAGIARAYPMQHAINVAAAVTLGPGPAVVIAFMISLFRNMLGLGTLLAFPGSMVGAFLAGYLYQKSGRNGLAALGEGVGSSIIGALASVPFAYLFMGSSVGAFAFIPPFLVSSTTGAIIGWFIVSRIKTVNVIRH
ncbi:energy coupling factor transporter S component ThiW [Oceanobacillus chungangensis]|uniref:Energy coupling factor transporter S component ThiW n=1 Tax=Oceanobacillus chungangensis TaxID=1229152 RepID=A0A3D8Q070_9BACI|nr:energy coupling factor transporter S component ThiW [Oceanobacillus chungangensis]RDW21227.1 energy coupling factor transporter S component ThiW [Oceanobacillus chungangensis]